MQHGVPTWPKLSQDMLSDTGARVTSGMLYKQSAFWRVLRNGDVIYSGACNSLKHKKLEVETAGNHSECGVVLAEGAFKDIAPGDVLQCVRMVSKKMAASG